MRHSRYMGLVPMDKFTSHPHHVVGVGAIGRQIAIALATMGDTNIHLYDFDTVEVENQGPQGYRPDQVGRLKTEATAEDCHQINPRARITVHEGRVEAGGIIDPEGTLWLAVDDITVRGDLASTCCWSFLVDGRMGGEGLQVYGVDPDHLGDYMNTIIPKDQIEPIPCTERSTWYTAGIAAGMMIQRYVMWIRHGLVLPPASLELRYQQLSLGWPAAPALA